MGHEKEFKTWSYFPLVAYLQMVKFFLIISFITLFFSSNQNKRGLKLNTWNVVFQHNGLKLSRAACKWKQGSE